MRIKFHAGVGGRTRLRNQMKRLFHCQIELIHEHEHGERFIASRIADRSKLWRDPKRPDERMLWESNIRLGEDFFNQIIRHPVPLDMNTLKALSRSSPGLNDATAKGVRGLSPSKPAIAPTRLQFVE